MSGAKVTEVLGAQSEETNVHMLVKLLDTLGYFNENFSK